MVYKGGMPYETDSHIMRGGRLVLKPKKSSLPLNDPIRQIRIRRAAQRFDYAKDREEANQES